MKNPGDSTGMGKIAQKQEIPGYEITGRLGAGAMAVVYKAKQISLNRTVAIKVLPKRFSDNPRYVESFNREAEAAGRLSHNNIVRAIDFGVTEKGYHYFVMEYIDGRTVYDDLAAGKIFTEHEALDIVIQVARGLEHAHKNGFVHRDIKPQNIMINKDGMVKIADMGLAKETADTETAEKEKGTYAGTPKYISPEQIRGEVDVDGRSDIYSLGATLYHMVTGKVPFYADDHREILRMHLKSTLVPPDHIRTDLSAGLGQIVEMMMMKDRQQRYGSASQLIEDLELVRDGNMPRYANREIDFEKLRELETGDDVQEGNNDVYVDTTPYKIGLIILSVAVFVCIIIIIVLSAKLAGR